MAHRLQFSKDINLPKEAEDYRKNLQNQIKKLRERQQILIQENEQKLALMRNRLIYGKKKIFVLSDDRNSETLKRRLLHYNELIQDLKKSISKEEQLLKRQSTKKQEQMQNFIAAQAINQDFETKTKILKSQKQQRTDFRQQLMDLTHEIMRLKKSLQQVRSKYRDNFTEYKLKQQYTKIKTENQQIVQQLKHLEIIKKSFNQTTLFSNTFDVNYDELQIIKQCQFTLKERNLLKMHLEKLLAENEEKKRSDEAKVQEFTEKKIQSLQSQVDSITKQNLILTKQIEITDKQIARRRSYQQKIIGRQAS